MDKFIDFFLLDAHKVSSLDTCTLLALAVIGLLFYIRYIQKRHDKYDESWQRIRLSEVEAKITTANALNHLADLVQNHLLSGGK